MVDCLSVPLVSLRTGAIFDVVGDAISSDKVSVAKWAHKISTAMNLGVQVLSIDETEPD